MSTSRKKIAIVAALGLGSLGLVGVGAGASFTDSVSATQRINTGTLSMAISSDGGTVSQDGKSITFDLSNSGSQINELHQVTITNTGSLPLLMSSVSVGHNGDNDPTLANDVTMNLDGAIMKVAAAQSTGWACIGADCTIQPGHHYTFPMNFTADLSNPDEGKTITPTLTVGASEVPATTAPRTTLARGVTHIAPAK